MADPWYIDPVTLTLRLLLALFLGGLIGLERERNHHAAGFRTHILVSIGSALIMILSMYGFADFVGQNNVTLDPSRLAAQVISGIGFLGAGVILRNGFAVTGLTTAASLWVAAAIGLAAGAGSYLAAVITTAFVLFCLLVLNKVEHKWLHSKKHQSLKIRTIDKPGILAKISAILQSKKIQVRKLSIEQDITPPSEVSDQQEMINILFSVKLPKTNLLLPMIEEIRQIQGISEVSVE